MRIDVRALGEALAVRLNHELPDGCWLRCEPVEGRGGAALFMYTAEGSWGGSGIAGMADTIDVHELPFFTEMILDAIQDDVAHASKGVAWPSDPTVTVPAAEPWAKVADGVLSFGYGSRTFGEGIEVTEIST